MEKLALVVVDLQNDFLPPEGSLAVPNGRDVIQPIKKLLDSSKYRFEVVIATQDWHPLDHCSFASQHNMEPYSSKEFTHPEGKKDSDGNVLKLEQTLWPDHCVQESKGAELEADFKKSFDRLKVPHTIVKKGYFKDRECYSCFGDCWDIDRTEIDAYLKEHKITDVVFVGIAYDFCVLQSAKDCAKQGYKTYVVKEACKSVYAQREPVTDNMYRANGVTITHSNDYFLTKFK